MFNICLFTCGSCNADLLSTVDQGKGMMQMLNGTPIDILTWGNHEADLPHEAVLAREKEYNGHWVNTNMQSHESFTGSKCQTDKLIIDVSSADGSHTRRVGLLAVLSDAKSLYKPGAFGGATIEDPWQTLADYKQRLEAEGVDMVLPLCHLYEAQDEKTCREFDFPVVLSGHDHHVVDRVYEGTRILKPGQDAHYAMQLDITWADANTSKPHIAAKLLKVSDWAADKALAKLVEASYRPLNSLRHTELTEVHEEFRPLSSVGARAQRTSVATFLCTAIRTALNTHVPAALKVGERHAVLPACSTVRCRPA